MRIEEPETVLGALVGHSIVGGQDTPDGLHILFDDGRVLIFTGEFIIAVYQTEEKAVH